MRNFKNWLPAIQHLYSVAQQLKFQLLLSKDAMNTKVQDAKRVQV